MRKNSGADDLKFFQDWWKIFCKYKTNPPKITSSNENDKFWEGLINEVVMLGKPYENTENGEFYIKMGLNMISEIERRAGHE